VPAGKPESRSFSMSSLHIVKARAKEPVGRWLAKLIFKA
jgi:hypothetical protein